MQLEKEAKLIAEKILEYRGRKIKIISHIDADGIAAGSIASIALRDAQIEHEIEFVKQIDEVLITRLKSENWAIIWFTDLGSGYLGQLNGVNAVITDHHVPEQVKPMGNPQASMQSPGKRTLFSYSDETPLESESRSPKTILQLNPHMYGINGAIELSGAGATYLVARQLSSENSSLAPLAIVGAVGDLQDNANRKLTGINSEIVSEAESRGVISRTLDIRFFGRETRPIFKLLQYSSDPILPELSGSEENCINFLVELGVKLKEDENWRRWIDLEHGEKKKIISELVKRLIKKGVGHESAKRLVGEVYILKNENDGTELHDAKEFATLLNACGRYEKAEVGYRVCCGDRAEYLKRAQSLLAGHRKTLVESIQLVKELGIIRLRNIQYFDAGDKVRDTVVGTVAGMLINSGEIDNSIPVIALSRVNDPERGEGIKASSRGTKALVDKGLDLSVIMRKAAESVGGYGGGHNIAAGAFIPIGKEKEFLEIVDRMAGEQVKKSV
jgi:RecJ-like exonuclease